MNEYEFAAREVQKSFFDFVITYPNHGIIKVVDKALEKKVKTFSLCLQVETS